MISVAIIGSGNVAHHLTKAFFKAKEVNVVQVYARHLANIEHLQKKTAVIDDLKKLRPVDVVIIAVSDNAIATVSSKIHLPGSLVVHTSGSIDMKELKNNGSKGVFYPLQSFSKDKEVNFKEIPFCLEAENKKDLKVLEQLASTIGRKIYPITSKQRQQLHVAAVFVNNFVNHLYKIGNDICDAYQVPFEILQPLIQETALKIEKLPPAQAQTGPAKRNDTKTIKNHLDLLKKEQQEIYKLLTKSIQNG
ncbi:Rossmann-like and DUF2520 domain-containing protein [Tenacibaculum sp. IB213877]|uniref:Rossmann-like and DUF2520 domain-containing protein n=1 Tax=Tenacibaculum sp. IB213877 TaxID=3097351 RepID=UPI002A5A7684|nr:Rossmann-like and DUF2520 domain-containing protein [Tenacibaculum sp. IB213877]MDY0781494.1 Rossmann-like and DUF2520 domain-containing protein [Tenacibaculum sp. IB213877]